MSNPSTGAALNRRYFLRMMGLGAAATAGGGLLAGCSKEPGSRGTATDVSGLDALLPRYQPMDLVKPDIAGTRPVADGFTRYPATLVDAITERPGSSGQTIKAMTPWWGPTPPGLGSNSYLGAVNADLGVPVDFSVQDGNTYGDKLGAVLGARDVPDLLCVPSWEYSKIPRFSEAVAALFEDLTDHLKGDAVLKYPMLANLPTGAWRYAFWNKRLAAVPWPTDGPFPWALFVRKDLLDAAGLAYPKSLDDLYTVGKQVTNPAKGVWAFNDIFAMVQMFHKVSGTEGGWRRKADGNLEFKYETAEFKASVEFMARVFKDGLVHPDLVASEGGDAKQLFSSGKIVFMQDGVGAWQGMQRDQSKVTPGFNMQPVPIFSATGGDPLVWGSDAPIFYTFIKKGLGQARTEELLRVLNWNAAPLGTKEFELREYGEEGRHFTRGAGGTPATTALYQKEYANQFGFIVGRAPAIIGSAETPNFVQDLLSYSNAMVKFLQPNPWAGIKLEVPANYAKVGQPTEDKIIDIVRGRRPLADLDQVVADWRTGGGEEGRTFFAQALADAGR